MVGSLAAAVVVVAGFGAAAVGSASFARTKPDPLQNLVQNEHSRANRPTVQITIGNAPPPVPSVFDGVKMTYDPFKPSGGPYPRLKKGEEIWVDVSIDQQLVYVFHGRTLLYTMATSSGMQSVPTDGSPPGVYHIQAERGTWFYVPRYHEGAEYWVSWLGHGLYLFHSVPMNRNRKVIAPIAARLLHEASHGCFHLTIPDAKWFYEHVPYGTMVIVERSPVLLEGRDIYDASRDQLEAINSTQPR